MPIKLGFDETRAFLREALGRKVELRDAGKKGQVDPGDVLVFKKNGKVVKTTLGKTRFEQARMQLAVVNAARQFADAGVDFAWHDQKDQPVGRFRMNEELWSHGLGGRMRLRSGVKPSDAINDIFQHGDKYAMECATGTMVILLKGMLDRLGPEDFDAAVKNPKLSIFRWTDEAPAFTRAKRVGKLEGFLPGDHTYFVNPQYHPDYAEWQGENVVYLGNGEYFGHGVGYGTAKEIVTALNENRRPGATLSAHRDDGFELRLDPKEIEKLDLHPD